jgi:hypothetical protein
MGIAETLDKLQALHRMVVAILRSRSRHIICARMGIGVGFRPGPLGTENVCFLLPATSLRARFRLPARLPEHRYGKGVSNRSNRYGTT